MKRLAIILSVVLVSIAVFLIMPRPTYGDSKSVIYIPVNTEVEHGLAGFIKRSIDEAKKNDAQAIVLGIDTFGGRVDAALAIVNYIEQAGDVPVIAYITDKAWSAGALIALGCDQIFMKPGSSIGSATPVASGGPVNQTKALSEKYISAIRAKFRSVAEKNGYSPNLAAAMVDKDLEVKEVIIDGQKQYLTNEEIILLKNQNKKLTVGKLVIGKDKLLNMTAKQAVDVMMAKAEVANMNELLTQMEMQGANIVNKKRNWAEHFASFATSATISGILLMLGLMALYTELSHPGFGWAGIVGLACLGLLFWGKYVVNLAEMTEMILFAIGVLLLLIEIFVIPGFGITGIVGLAFIAISLYLAFVPFVMPVLPWDFSLFFKTITMMTIAVVASILGFFIVVHFIPELPGMKRLVLTTSLKPGMAGSEKDSDQHELLGKNGEAISDLRPVGKAQFGDSIIDVVSESGFLNKGVRIEIIKVEGNRILVRERKA